MMVWTAIIEVILLNIYINKRKHEYNNNYKDVFLMYVYTYIYIWLYIVFWASPTWRGSNTLSEFMHFFLATLKQKNDNEKTGL